MRGKKHNCAFYWTFYPFLVILHACLYFLESALAIVYVHSGKNILMYRCGIFKISKVSVVCCVKGVKECHLNYFFKEGDGGWGGGGRLHNCMHFLNTNPSFLYCFKFLMSIANLFLSCKLAKNFSFLLTFIISTKMGKSLRRLRKFSKY